MRSNAVLIRTTGDRKRLRAVLASIAKMPSADAYVVFDCVSSPDAAVDAEFDGVPIIKVTRDFINAAGLQYFKQVMWQCGDYCYYAAYDQIDQYNYYWCIDDDVVFNLGDQDFFSEAEKLQEDLLGVQLGPRKENWGWYASMAHLNEGKVFGMLYPISRLSNAAVKHLAIERSLYRAEVDHSVYSTSNDLIRQHANDEAFTASTLVNAGFTRASISYIFQKEFSGLFSTERPVLMDELSAPYAEGKIVHPICEIPRAKEKLRIFIKKYGYRNDIVTRLEQIRNSCGDLVVMELLEHLPPPPS